MIPASTIIDTVRQQLAECEPRSAEDLAATCACSQAELLAALANPECGVERCAPPDDLEEHVWWWTRTGYMRARMARAGRRERRAA